MRERGMIFNAQMVRAILEGRKTQTRRVMKVQPEPSKTRPGDYWFSSKRLETMIHLSDLVPGNCAIADSHLFYLEYCCPFGQPGDRLWVRETCQAVELESGLDVVRYAADSADIPVKAHPLDAGMWIDLYRYRKSEGKIVPSIHMPRWASRITLEIVSVRVERLNDIDRDGAIAEGITDPHGVGQELYLFTRLWRDIYDEDSWQDNPWVWVIEFKHVEGANS